MFKKRIIEFIHFHPLKTNILFYIKIIIKLINRANYILFLVRVQVFRFLKNYLKKKKEKEIFPREKIGQGKECVLELFTNSCHFIENENM